MGMTPPHRVPVTAPRPLSRSELSPGPRLPGTAWLGVLVVGIGLFELLQQTLIATQNPNLVPALILVGAVVVPAAFVAFVDGRRLGRRAAHRRGQRRRIRCPRDHGLRLRRVDNQPWGPVRRRRRPHNAWAAQPCRAHGVDGSVCGRALVRRDRKLVTARGPSLYCGRVPNSHAAPAPPSSSGSRTVTTVPSPSFDWRSMLPRWLATMVRTMVRPMPVPAIARSAAFEAR